MTLKEIFEKHGAGTKISFKNLDNITRVCMLCGPTQRQDYFVVEWGENEFSAEESNLTGFEVYTEPKPQVERWLWAMRNKNEYKDNNWYCSEIFYSENEIESQRDKYKELKKLEWSRQVFDE